MWKLQVKMCSKYTNDYIYIKYRIQHLDDSYLVKNEKHFKYFKLVKVQSMDDKCGEWVECMGVASGCGEQEVGVTSGSGWNLWVWLVGSVVRRYHRVGRLYK